MLRRKRVVLYVAVGVIAGLAVTVYLPWYAVGPGPARAVQPLIRFEDRTRYESQGTFVMTSVRYTRLTGLDMLLAWLDPDRAVVARSVLYPDGENVQVERERSISQMDSSKLDASAVVLRALEGYPKDHGDGVLVESVVSDCAADGELFPGDRILSIEGEPVDSFRDASRAIESSPSGSTLTFDLSVDGDPETVDLVREPCGDSEEPSVGLMWALGLYDLLTPGDLTDGRTIAGTGQIALDGTVFPIEGIDEKLSAAADAGASVFLVPQGNMTAARASGGHGLELVPVATFDDALSYLHGR
jgi:PDZ domain-containing protein